LHFCIWSNVPGSAAGFTSFTSQTPDSGQAPNKKAAPLSAKPSNATNPSDTNLKPS